jgi:hypothetical protein
MTHNELRAKLLELYPDSDNSELKLKNTELRLAYVNGYLDCASEFELSLLPEAINEVKRTYK